MPWMLEQPQWPVREPFVRFKKALSLELCQRLRQWAEQKQGRLVEATIGEGDTDHARRRSQVAWLNWDDGDVAVEAHKAMAAVCQDARANWYPFHLAGFVEPMQVTRYRGDEAGHYDWHCDLGAKGQSPRKLSMVVQLCPCEDFTGGELEMMGIVGDGRAVRNFEEGEALVFPAWEQHRVLPVRSGTRWSLVAWVHGHPFT